MVGRDHQHVRIAHQLERLERAVGEWGTAKREIEVTALDRAVEIRVGRRLGEPELDPGPVGEEPPHHLGQHACPDALVGADAERAGLAGAQRRHVCPRRLEPRHDRLRVTQEQRAGLGHRDGTRATGPLDELLVDDPLERRDLLADGGLRVAELGGGATERASTGHRFEGGEVPDLDPEPVVEAENDQRE